MKSASDSAIIRILYAIITHIEHSILIPYEKLPYQTLIYSSYDTHYNEPSWHTHMNTPHAIPFLLFEIHPMIETCPTWYTHMEHPYILPILNTYESSNICPIWIPPMDASHGTPCHAK